MDNKNKVAKITAPNNNYNGKVKDCQFDAGVGFTDNEALIAYFEKAGYKVERNTKEASKLTKVENERLSQELAAALEEIVALKIENERLMKLLYPSEPQEAEVEADIDSSKKEKKKK